MRRPPAEYVTSQRAPPPPLQRGERRTKAGASRREGRVLCVSSPQKETAVLLGTTLAPLAAHEEARCTVRRKAGGHGVGEGARHRHSRQAVAALQGDGALGASSLNGGLRAWRSSGGWGGGSIGTRWAGAAPGASSRREAQAQEQAQAQEVGANHLQAGGAASSSRHWGRSPRQPVALPAGSPTSPSRPPSAAACGQRQARRWLGSGADLGAWSASS